MIEANSRFLAYFGVFFSIRIETHQSQSLLISNSSHLICSHTTFMLSVSFIIARAHLFPVNLGMKKICYCKKCALYVWKSVCAIRKGTICNCILFDKFKNPIEKRIRFFFSFFWFVRWNWKWAKEWGASNKCYAFNVIICSGENIFWLVDGIIRVAYALCTPFATIECQT